TARFVFALLAFALCVCPALRFRIRAEVPAAARRSARHRAATGVKRSRAAERSGRTRREASATGARTREAAWSRRTARPAIFTRARFADGQRPPVEHLPVELLDRFLGVSAIEELDERKAARSARFAIDGEHDLRGWRHGAEVRAKVGFGRGVVEITNEQTDGQSTLSYFGKK